MGKTMVNSWIDYDLKEMAKSKGINMSHTLSSALEAELEIADIPVDEEDKIIRKLKQKVRKLLEIQRDLRTEMAKKQAKIVRFEAKKQAKQDKNEPEQFREIPPHLKNDGRMPYIKV